MKRTILQKVQRANRSKASNSRLKEQLQTSHYFWSSLNRYNSFDLVAPLATKHIDCDIPVLAETLDPSRLKGFKPRVVKTNMPERKAAAQLSEWVYQNLQKLSKFDCRSMEWFYYKEAILNNGLGEIIKAVKVDCQERGVLLEKIIQTVLQNCNTLLAHFSQVYKERQIQFGNKINRLHVEYQGLLDMEKASQKDNLSSISQLQRFKQQLVRINRSLNHEVKRLRKSLTCQQFKNQWNELQIKTLLQQNLYLHVQNGDSSDWLKLRYRKSKCDKPGRRVLKLKHQKQVASRVESDLRWAERQIWDKYLRNQSLEIDALGTDRNSDSQSDEEQFQREMEQLRVRKTNELRDIRRSINSTKQMTLKKIPPEVGAKDQQYEEQSKSKSASKTKLKKSSRLQSVSHMRKVLFQNFGSKNQIVDTQDLCRQSEAGVQAVVETVSEGTVRDYRIQSRQQDCKHIQTLKNTVLQKSTMTEVEGDGKSKLGLSLIKQKSKSELQDSQKKQTSNLNLGEAQIVFSPPSGGELNSKASFDMENMASEKNRASIEESQSSSVHSMVLPSKVSQGRLAKGSKSRIARSISLVEQVQKKKEKSHSRLKSILQDNDEVCSQTGAGKYTQSKRETPSSEKLTFQKFHQYYKRIRKEDKLEKEKQHIFNSREQRRSYYMPVSKKRQVHKQPPKESVRLSNKVNNKIHNLTEYARKAAPSNLIEWSTYEKAVQNLTTFVPPATKALSQQSVVHPSLKKSFASNSKIFSSIIAEYCKVYRKESLSIESLICSNQRFQRVLYPINVFLYEKFMNKFGLKSVAEKNLKALLEAIVSLQHHLPEAEVFARLIGTHSNSSSEDLTLYVRMVVFLDILHQRGELNLNKSFVSRKSFQENAAAIFQTCFSKQQLQDLEKAIFDLDQPQVELSRIAVFSLRLYSQRVRQTQASCIKFKGQTVTFQNFIRLLCLLGLPIEREIFFERSFLAFCDLNEGENKAMTQRRYHAFCLRYSFLSVKEAVAHARSRCGHLEQPFNQNILKGYCQSYLVLKLEEEQNLEMKQLIRWLITQDFFETRIVRESRQGLQLLFDLHSAMISNFQKDVRRK